MKKRICIDIDGVICEIRSADISYRDLSPIPGAVEAIRTLRDSGHYIILYTARHMKSTSANVGLVLAKQGLITLEWLEKHKVPFDEIHFGKPWADYYIDDNAVRFESWKQILEIIDL